MIGLVGVVGGVAAIVLSTRGDAAQRRSEPEPVGPRRGVPRRLACRRLPRDVCAGTPGVRASVTYHQFARAYRDVARTASMTGVRAEGRLRATPAMATVPVSDRDDHVRPHSAAAGDPARAPAQELPGRLDAGADVPGASAGRDAQSRVHAPEGRGRILARDGTVLAEGPPGNRAYPAGTAFALVTGFTKLAGGAAIAARHKAGWPAGRKYGQGGLEESLDDRWAAFPVSGSWRRRRRPGARAASWPESRGGSPRTS